MSSGCPVEPTEQRRIDNSYIVELKNYTMKKALNIFLSGIALAVLVSFFANDEKMDYNYLTLGGLTCLVLSALGLFVSLFLFVAKDKETAKSLLIATGLMLFTGVVTCSVFPMNLNVH